MLSKRQLRAVLFDLDDTLLDWSGAEHSLESLLRPHLEQLFDHLEQVGIAKDEDFLFFIHAFYDYSHQAWSDARQRDQEMPHFIELLRGAMRWGGLDPTRVDMDAALAAFGWRCPSFVKPFEDTQETLEGLKARGLKLGIITNSFLTAQMRRAELAAHGLEDYFEVILTCSDVGRPKPHPSIFWRGLEALGVEAHEAVFVGDSLKADIRGAKAAQLTSVHFFDRARRGETILKGVSDGDRPDYTITRLRELLSLF